MAFDQIPTSVTIINSGMIGYQGISLTDFTLSSASLIASGSAVEIAGAFFKASTDITPNATSWSAISALTSAYLELTPSGTAGSQILTAAWSSTVPTWSTAKQGWYASAGSNVRVVATAYKTAGGTYNNKCILQNNGQNDYRMRGITVNLTSGSGNWIVPTDVYRLSVICVGGGGGGGTTNVAGAPGPSGGSGGGGGTIISLAMASILNVVPNQSIAYSVGVGGAPGSAGNPGSSGTSTTFAGATTGNAGGGGNPGLQGNASYGGTGGAGGNGASGSFGAIGCPGQTGALSGTANAPGGGGGSASYYGSGGYGGNGGGTSGGTGGSGIITITY